jgi:hypothetical protein
MNQIGSQGRQPIILALRPPVFDDNILPLDVADVAKALVESVQKVRKQGGRFAAEEPDYRHGLLRVGREGPRSRAAEK